MYTHQQWWNIEINYNYLHEIIYYFSAARCRSVFPLVDVQLWFAPLSSNIFTQLSWPSKAANTSGVILWSFVWRNINTVQMPRESNAYSLVWIPTSNLQDFKYKFLIVVFPTDFVVVVVYTSSAQNDKIVTDTLRSDIHVTTYTIFQQQQHWSQHIRKKDKLAFRTNDIEF